VHPYIVLDVAAARFRSVDIFTYFGLNNGNVLKDRISVSRRCWPCMSGHSSPYVAHRDPRLKYKYALHNDISVKEGLHILYYAYIIVM